MTRKKTKTLAAILLSLGLLIALPPGAWADPVSMTLTGVYNSNNVMGGVYDSPYLATIGSSSTPTLVICDDFTTDISVGQSWSAYQNTLSAVTTSGPQKFTTPDYSGLTIQQEYDAAALLAEDLLANLNGANDPNSILVGEYSYAIWTIFDPSAITGYLGQLNNISIQTEIASLRNTAFSEVLAGVTPSATVSIYTPKPLTASQEFLVVNTPEASTLAILIVDVLGLAGVVFVLRRRLTGKLSN